jgi:hypothetical protein
MKALQKINIYLVNTVHTWCLEIEGHHLTTNIPENLENNRKSLRNLHSMLIIHDDDGDT